MHSTQPAISVIVRTIGKPERLAEALGSLVQQTRRDFEAVVVDMSGGANDAVLTAFASQLRLRVVKTARTPRPRALNLGIAAASAPVIAILDDDNLYDREQLATFLDGLAATRADYVYCGVRHATYDAEGRQLGVREMVSPYAFESLLAGNFIYATGSAYRKELWQRLGGYDERFDVLEDWELILRAAQAGTIAHLPVIAGTSRKFTGSATASNFDLEIDAVRKCQAGIYWKHRRLFLRNPGRDVLRHAFAHHASQRHPPRTGLLARSVRGWRLELFADLAAWFVHALRRREKLTE
jgi:glycosyltransferase involved in cell wall biosynthesis